MSSNARSDWPAKQNGKPAVLDSCVTLAELVRVTKGENFVLTILECRN